MFVFNNLFFGTFKAVRTTVFIFIVPSASLAFVCLQPHILADGHISITVVRRALCVTCCNWEICGCYGFFRLPFRRFILLSSLLAPCVSSFHHVSSRLLHSIDILISESLVTSFYIVTMNLTVFLVCNLPLNFKMYKL